MVNAVTSTGCSNQVTGMNADFQTKSGATCESYTSADPADQMVVGWSCAANGPALVYNWVYPKGTQSCDIKKQFICVTTPDLTVEATCGLAAGCLIMCSFFSRIGYQKKTTVKERLVRSWSWLLPVLLQTLEFYNMFPNS